MIAVPVSLFGRFAPAYGATAGLATLSLPLFAVLLMGPRDPTVAPRLGPGPYVFIGFGFLALALALVVSGANASVGLFLLFAAYSFALAVWLRRWATRASARGLKPRR